MKNNRYVFTSFLMMGLLFAGCSSTNETRSGETRANQQPDIEIHDPSLRLSDYLQRVGGVDIHETGGKISVIIRGNFSFEAETQPLYVIDGVRSGHDYNRVERMVPVQNIFSVQILKGSEASVRYGLAGSNGAIVIRTK